MDQICRHAETSQAAAPGVQTIPGAQPTPEACRSALHSILSSKTFRASEGQKAFLRYVGERAISGSAALIKEYSIGVEVFQLGSDFDPRLNPIVRVMARKLRAGLARYYSAEGAADAVAVELPKGSYVPSFIQRFEAPVAVDCHPETSAPPQPAPTLIKTTSLIPHARVALLLALLVTVAGLAVFELRSPGTSAASFTPSVGVLPFTTLTDAREDASTADGLTEGLIESLERVPGLQVAASASSFQFKGKTIKLREAGEKLNVHALVEGVVRRSEGHIHLTVQLVNAINGYKLWSESYDRLSTELPALEREVSQSILSAVGAADSADHHATMGPNDGGKSSHNAAAYGDYMEGRRLWSQFSITSVTSAIQYFERAIAEDPAWAQPYAGLAYCYAVIPQLTDARTPEMNARVRHVAAKALSLDSALGEAHIALAIAAAYEHDWEESEQNYRVGLDLSPGDPVGHLWFGGYLTMMGRFDEALVQRRMAVQLDPLSGYAWEEFARTYFYARRYDEAIRHYQQALRIQPSFGLAHQGLGRAYVQKGMYREGIDELLIANRILGATPRRRGFLAYAYAVSGGRKEARKILDDFLASYNRGPFPAIVIADIYLGLGEQEQALQWLEKVVVQKDIFSKADPLYDPIRANAKFAALVRLLKL